MGRSITWTMDDLVFLMVRFFSFKNLVYVIIFAFALPLMAWIFVAKNEPSMDFAAAMEMQVKYYKSMSVYIVTACGLLSNHMTCKL